MRTLGKEFSMVYTTKQHTPSQLVSGRDAIFNINQEASWQFSNNVDRR